MATKLQWFKDRPFLLWLALWSVYFEGMRLLWGAKGPNLMLLGLHLSPTLFTLLLCVRPAIARTLRVLYGLAVPLSVILPLRTNLDFGWGVALGGGCMSALFIDLMIAFVKQQSQKKN